MKLDESAIWEPGDDVVGLEKQIDHSLQITVDGIPIPAEDVIILVDFGPPTIVYDEAGNSIGSHAGFSHVYFTPAVAGGLHTVTIEVETTSGVKYSYTWIIRRTAIHTPS